MPEGESSSATFVVRVTWRPDRATGVVERVRTGERERFDGFEEIGVRIARMLDEGRPGGPPDSIPTQQGGLP